MRLDLFLKASRLCPRRGVAQTLCEAGLVLLNGRPARSSHSVKPGDEIMIRRRSREMTIKVLTVPEGRQHAKKDAASLYELLSESVLASEEP